MKKIFTWLKRNPAEDKEIIPIGKCPLESVGIGNVDLTGRGSSESEARIDLHNQMAFLCDQNPNTHKCVGACQIPKCCKRAFTLASTIGCSRLPDGEYVCRYKGLLSCRCECSSECQNQGGCKLSLEAIKFNHDPNSFHCDAKTILNEEVPEWKRGETRPEQSNAEYSVPAIRGNTVSVRVKLKLIDPLMKEIFIAIKAEGGGVLGPLDLQIVRFVSGITEPEFIFFPLNHHSLSNEAKSQDISWRWKYRCLCNGPWQDLGTTNHRIIVDYR